MALPQAKDYRVYIETTRIDEQSPVATYDGTFPSTAYYGSQPNALCIIQGDNVWTATVQMYIPMRDQLENAHPQIFPFLATNGIARPFTMQWINVKQNTNRVLEGCMFSAISNMDGYTKSPTDGNAAVSLVNMSIAGTKSFLKRLSNDQIISG